MSIEMYDRAAVIKKDGTNYYMVKHGSKNTFNIGRRTSNDFRPEYKQRESRCSDWRVVAKGEGKMADTSWNAPTGWIYGRIQFGNKRNIALYLDKQKPRDFENFDEVQQGEIASIIDGYNKPNRAEWVIDLKNIKPEKQVKTEHEYCGNVTRLADHAEQYEGRDYWSLDNL